LAVDNRDLFHVEQSRRREWPWLIQRPVSRGTSHPYGGVPLVKIWRWDSSTLVKASLEGALRSASDSSCSTWNKARAQIGLPSPGHSGDPCSTWNIEPRYGTNSGDSRPPGPSPWHLEGQRRTHLPQSVPRGTPVQPRSTPNSLFHVEQGDARLDGRVAMRLE
jgi:hypothetical protein